LLQKTLNKNTYTRKSIGNQEEIQKEEIQEEKIQVG